MLIPLNLLPDDCVYYNASFVLKALLKKRKQALGDLFCEVCSHHVMSFTMFVFCLDWLYLIGSIRADEEKIELCI